MEDEQMNTMSVTKWLTCIAMTLAMVAPAAADEEVAALVVDTPSGRFGAGRLCIAGFPSDPSPARCASLNAVTSSPGPTAHTQNILTDDSCGSMDVNTFFSHSFNLLKLRGRDNKLSCKQQGTPLAFAFKWADANHDGLLSEAEFLAFRNTWGTPH
jgi:hypothetical protein